ncbi:adenylosuccinate synthetase [Nitrosomonas halophila]|uniref:Adenylosuccinate synthetase n=1 Tax=Nitrosomonas halophila TaxID=44576 RepID=A0A1H3DS38_9PROT|nr:adenylosuccinate synthetase [Nitrosomonas halophila]SDX69181.1 adenylosuccinate synthase [Nitrosomonas halophila]
MPVTVIVGGQFGSEGKGKVAHFLAKEMHASVVIRVGGPNSGHTVISEEGPLIFRQLPTAAILPDVKCVLPAGSYIFPSRLLEEIHTANLSPARLLIDPNAIIITPETLQDENQSMLGSTIGSTQSGTGAAVLARISRLGRAKLAQNEESLKPYIRPATSFLREKLDKKERVIIEGTQGFGLSVLHARDYPFTTSRDTTAAGFVAEAGLSPLDVDDIVLVIRAFPIRVAGNSGPLPREFTWQELADESGSNAPIIEYTSVTKTVRRVARFDPEIVRDAIMYNKPTRIVLNHLDYIDTAHSDSIGISSKCSAFLRYVESEIGCRITYTGLGPNHLIPLENLLKLA